MKALHCLWIPKDVYKGALFVWCESPEMLKSKGKTKTAVHPFAVPGEGLKALLKDALGEKFPGIENEIQECRTKLVLPADKMPEMSRKLSEFYPDMPSEGKARHASWTVEGVRIRNQSAHKFLFGLSENMLKGIILGDDVIFWQACLKFVFELAIRQRFLPSFSQEKGRFYGVWKPSYDSPKDRKRFLSLEKSMPGICRSFSDSTSAGGVLNDFISTLIDRICRIPLSSAYTYTNKLDMEAPVDRWIAGLAGTPLISNRDGIESLKAKWEAWLARSNVGNDLPFRLCFKLDAEENGWVLSFLVQKTGDPSIIFPAGDIWRQIKKGSIAEDSAFPYSHEQLLGDLGTAVRFFPPLEKGLRRSAPEFCRLKDEDVYPFIKETSTLMEEIGFGVLLPSWLKDGSNRLGVKLSLKSSPTKVAGAGLMGLNTVLAFDWRLALGNQPLTDEEMEILARQKIPFVKIRGKWVEFSREELEKTLKNLKSRDALTLSEAIRMEAGLAEGLPVTEIRCEKGISNLFEALRGQSKLSDLEQPGDFHGLLRKYQIEGFSWLDFLSRYGFGACLADDMGLGKTIQLIALLLHKKKSGEAGQSLLICPTSIVGNWEREIKKFSPSLRVMIHHGERLKGRDFVREAKKHDILITTYSLSHRDEEQLGKINWYLVVLDEAQNIKNPHTKQSASISRLPSKKRIVLTGTPVENRLSELWSIMNFLNPGFLGPWNEFREKFAIPIERYDDKKRLEILKRLLQPFVLRRVKTDKKIICDLPEKQENKLYCGLTPEQASLYKAVVDSSMEEIENSEGIRRKGIILGTLTKLKQICNHPASFTKDRKGMENRSGKLERVGEMVEEVLEGGDKCLIFTQFAEMGGMLKSHFQEQLNCEVLFLHGGVSREKREEFIKKFQEGDPGIFILSLKAGGTGLNLTAANHVFHFDRWWNPAVENQATDRAFRIGQKKNVFVYKFICEGTIEERIDEMIEKKKGLAESIIGKGESWITELSTKDLRSLFSLRERELGD